MHENHGISKSNMINKFSILKEFRNEFHCFIFMKRCLQEKGGGDGGEESHVKMTGMLLVSFGCENHGFWSHLGCTGRNSPIFSVVKVYVRVATVLVEVD